MPTASSRPAAPGPTARGRRAEEALSEAVLDLLDEHGFSALTVDRIAGRAKVGKPTIYRRWDTKEALVAHVLGNLDPPEPFTPEGDLRETLIAILANLQRRFTDTRTGRVWQRLIGEADNYPEIIDLYERNYLGPRRRAIARLLAHNVASGRLRADLDIEAAVEILVAAMLGLVLNVRRSDVPMPSADAVVDMWLEGMATGR